MVQRALQHTPPTLRRGTAVGRYEVVSRIAATRSSRVYSVRHRLTGALATLKVGATAKHLLREAALLSKFVGPSIPRVLQTSLSSQPIDGFAWFVMEHIGGRTLAELLRQERRLEPAHALSVGMRLSLVLANCHEKRVVHGDVKPANLILFRQGADIERVVLIDFGAAVSGRADAVSQGSGVVLATPGYIAPEVWGGQLPSPAADVYSLGCVLYEALSGFRPHRDPDGRIIPVSELVPLSESLSRPIEQALAEEPKNRPADARAMFELLLQVDLDEVAQCSGIAGEAWTAPQEVLDTLELAESIAPPPPEAMPSQPYNGDVACLLSLEEPSVWLFTGDPGTDKPEILEGLRRISPRCKVEMLDAEARERKQVEILSGANPPWVILFGDLHVLMTEPLLETVARQGETSKLLVSTHANWELLDSSVNAIGLHSHVCFPASVDEITEELERMVERSQRLRRRYDGLRLALRDAQMDFIQLEQQAV